MQQQSWDHPRVCGEHELTLFENGLALGSSPRMRGTPFMRFCAVSLLGIIPAYAGNTVGGGRCGGGVRDHPRVCGEHFSAIRSALPEIGIIPAYAGNTGLIESGRRNKGDHPRVCGEHLRDIVKRTAPLGSSPRMRGTRIFRLGWMRGRGIIPAYAGNTSAFSRMVRRRRDHPRVCGEHPIPIPRKFRIRGSSPRMRGTH